MYGVWPPINDEEGTEASGPGGCEGRAGRGGDRSEVPPGSGGEKQGAHSPHSPEIKVRVLFCL